MCESQGRDFAYLTVAYGARAVDCVSQIQNIRKFPGTPTFQEADRGTKTDNLL